MDDAELQAAGKTFTVGEDLYGVSVKQLTERTEILKSELARIERALLKKASELSDAETFFNKS